MKKQLFFLVLAVLSISMQAQLVLTTGESGVVHVTYGSSDYSLYDPAGASSVYVYMWVNQDQTAPELASQYNDEWGDASSLVVLNWSDEASMFVGDIDFNTHDFIGEGIIPSATTINDFNFLLRNEAGDGQSVDLLASAYGFTATETLGNYDYQAEKSTYYSNGILHINALDSNESFSVRVFNSLGKEVYSKNISVNHSETSMDLSTLKDSLLIVYVESSANKYFVKKIIR